MLVALVSSLAIAGCHPAVADTTAKQPRTVIGSLPIAALHFDEAGGSAPINGRQTGFLEGRLAFAHCRWPSVTVSYVNSVNPVEATTDYVVPGSSGFHPSLYVSTDAVEIA